MTPLMADIGSPSSRLAAGARNLLSNFRTQADAQDSLLSSRNPVRDGHYLNKFDNVNPCSVFPAKPLG
jgi:hypothetical protein